MTGPREVRVLVEGYDDRALWSGYLQAVRGCTPSHQLPEARRRALPPDAQRHLKPGSAGPGAYLYLSPSGATLIRVVPYQEQRTDGDPLGVLIREAVAGRATRPLPLGALVLCRDDDLPAGRPPRHARADLVGRLLALGEAAVDPDPLGGDGILLADGARVLEVPLRCDDPPDPALPDKQTLERVAAAALGEVHPERLRSARGWLAARPDPTGPAADHKATAGALWAGWHARDGWARFYEALWDDPPVRGALLRRLPALDGPALRALLA